MTYICKSCGNQDRFTASQEITQYVTEEIIIDSDGDIIDYGDSDQTDSEVNEGPNNIECEDCSSENVEDLEDEELQEVINSFNEDDDEEETVINWKEELGEIKK